MKKNLCQNMLFLLLVLLLAGCMDAEEGVYEQREPIDAKAVIVSVANEASEFLEENFDDYFWYMTEEEYDDMMEGYYGEYYGIGVTMLFIVDEPYPFVSAVNRESPAKEAGIEPGEYIVAVEGEDIADWESDAISGAIKGPQGTKVTITMENADGERRDLTLTRRKIETFSVEERLIEDHPQIAYLAISNFSANTPKEFAEMYGDICEAREIEGLILDLRDNGGGSFPACLELAEHFIPRDMVLVHQKTRQGLTTEKSRGGLGIDIPVVILQNSNSASASEVFIGALTDHDKAVTVGTLSYGKGITQTIIALLNEHGYRYTASQYYTPDMYSLHGYGLIPDHDLPLDSECSYEDIAAANIEKDNQLAKAIELILGE